MKAAGVSFDGHQFHITSRMAATASTVDSWTCKRAHDGAMIQTDYIVADLRFEPTTIHGMIYQLELGWTTVWYTVNFS